MEIELREKRGKRKEEIAEFMEENVLVKWAKLKNQRRKIETRVKHSHEVCLKMIVDLVNLWSYFGDIIHSPIESGSQKSAPSCPPLSHA